MWSSFSEVEEFVEGKVVQYDTSNSTNKNISTLIDLLFGNDDPFETYGTNNLFANILIKINEMNECTCPNA